ncbi:hypothetical protein V6N13_103523 [Hibiscus sabdariffa]
MCGLETLLAAGQLLEQQGQAVCFSKWWSSLEHLPCVVLGRLGHDAPLAAWLQSAAADSSTGGYVVALPLQNGQVVEMVVVWVLTPKGESGVDCLLALVAGVAAGVGARLAAGVACGVAARLSGIPAGTSGSAYSDAVGVGIAIWMGVASATSIFLMYSFLVQPDFSDAYLSPGLAADISHAMTSPALNWKPVSIVLISTSLMRSMVWLWEVGIKFRLTKMFHSFTSGWRCARLIVFGLLPFTFHSVPASHSWSLIVSNSSSSSTSIKAYYAWAIFWQVENVVDCGGVVRHVPASY